MENKPRYRIFLLSPAYAGGQRARMILSERAQFELARKLRGKKGAPIAEVFEPIELNRRQSARSTSARLPLELFCITRRCEPIVNPLSYGREWYHPVDSQSEERGCFFDFTQRDGSPSG